MPDSPMSQRGYSGPGRYRHYKGGQYEVLGLAIQEDTVDKGAGDGFAGARTFVIYRPLSPGSLLEYRAEDFWARELSDFNATVTGLPRFTREA